MKKIAIVVGHGPKKDKGAVSQGGAINEFDWNSNLAAKIVKHIGGRVSTVLIFRDVEKLSPVEKINASNATVAVELHLNAANGKASGTEMLCWPTSKRGNLVATKLQKAAIDVLKLKDRGVKGPMNGRGERFLRKTKMPAVIVESFFIDNPSDLTLGEAKKEELAKAYADALVQVA